jgi:hypothetical protein
LDVPQDFAVTFLNLEGSSKKLSKRMIAFPASAAIANLIMTLS